MIRLALVGYGRIAPKHLEVFRALGAEFVAACNRSEAGRERARNEGGISRTYSDIAAMLAAERPDGVVCCPSVPQVYDVATQIIPSGVPALLEKPPGTSLDEFLALSALRAKHGTPVMIGLNRLHYSVVQQAIADAGGVDAISAVFVTWSENVQPFLARGLTPAHVERMIFGNSLHGLHLLTALAGDVPQPHVLVRTRGEFNWSMSLQGVSSRGALASFTSTWDSPGSWRVEFCVPGRRYVFAPLESCVVQTSGQSESRRIEPDAADRQFKAGFHRQAQMFLDVIASGQVPPGYGLDDAGPPMRLAENLTRACLEAA